jgi:hypothetical protein
MSVLAEEQVILSRGLEGGQNRRGGGRRCRCWFVMVLRAECSIRHYSANTPTCPPVCQNITVSESLNRLSRT